MLGGVDVLFSLLFRFVNFNYFFLAAEAATATAGIGESGGESNTTVVYAVQQSR